MKGATNRLTEACIIVTITVAILVALELMARLASHMRGRIAESSNPVLVKQPWGRQYEADQRGLWWRYAEYVEFREPSAYTSPTINLDDRGLRRVPGNCERPARVLTIWAFGGSTMFGYGVPDQSTIPAYVTGILDRAGYCARVVNFGAGGWQSSQSLIELVENLKRDRPPDAVIFYDGINDTDNVAQGAAPGAIDVDVHRQLDRALDDVGMVEAIARGSVLVRVVSNRLLHANDRRPVRVSRELAADRARAIASLYAANVRMVEALAKEYGFEAYFFLQPFPAVSRKQLTDAEKATLEQGAREGSDFALLRALYAGFALEPRLSADPRYFDIAGIFEESKEELFVDENHLLPEGNRTIAQRMARELLRTLPGP